MNYYQKWLCSFSNKLLENVTLLSKMTLQFCYIYSRAQIKAASVSTESPAMKVLILFCIIAATASADESINLSEGEALLVSCPGKSIGVMITGKEAGSWNVELQDSKGCSTSLESYSIERMGGIVYTIQAQLRVYISKSLKYWCGSCHTCHPSSDGPGLIEIFQEMFSLYSQLSLYLQSPPLAYIQSCTRLLLFGTFELAISMPVEVGKSYIQCLAKKLLFSPLYEVK